MRLAKTGERSIGQVAKDLDLTEMAPDWEAAWAKLTQKHTREEDKTYELTLGGVHYKHRFVRVNVADLVDEAAVTKLVHRPIEAWVET